MNFNLPIFCSLSEINTYYNSLTSEQHEALKEELYNKYKDSKQVVGNVDILNKASLGFLLVADVLEKRGRSSNVGCSIALEYLLLLYEKRLEYCNSLGVTLCDPYLHKKFFYKGAERQVPAMDYNRMCSLYANYHASRETDIAAWQIVYLITHSIFQKKERMETPWFDAGESFSSTAMFEASLEKSIAGLTYCNRGVRHDMYCPVCGTKDPDFLYTTSDGTIHTAEFKRALKTVKAIANYSEQKPEYIYNADYLFTYGPLDNIYGCSNFYIIDYTRVPYTITALPAADEAFNKIRNSQEALYETKN